MVFGVSLNIWTFTIAFYCVCSANNPTEVWSASLLPNARDNIFLVSGMTSRSMNLLLHWVTSLANTESFHQKDNRRVLGAELSVEHLPRMCKAPRSVNSTVTKLSDSV